jgi:hypothetical protein
MDQVNQEMTVIKKNQLDVLMAWPVAMIRKSMQNPTPYMSPVVLALHAIALRRKGESTSSFVDEQPE